MKIARSNQRMAIPYGSTAPRAAALAAIARGDCAGIDLPAAPVAVIDCGPKAPLRLADLVHPFTLPPSAQDLSHADKQAEILKSHILSLCAMWNRPQRAFVVKYFADVCANVDARATELRARMGDLTGLVELRHWCFAAHMIMPRAHIVLQPSGSPSKYVSADFALWSGSELVTCFVATESSVFGTRKRAIDTLVAAGVDVRHVDAGQLHNPNWSLLDAISPTTANFLDGVELADSPFRGRGLEAPVRAAR
ncbi:MAG: hypothetical protein ACR2PG_14165 [Hyphomicrobiaceae bacterium]